MVPSHADAVELVDHWRYVTEEPQSEWFGQSFDDSSWKEADAGLGNPSTPGARVGTTWYSDDIWMRKAYQLESGVKNPVLLIHHDDEAQVYLNGQLIAELEGYTTDYQLIRLDAKAAAALRKGTNTLAVHCQQSSRGQFIDAHLVSADSVPKLPRPSGDKKPFESELITEWGEKVTAENAWTEYPRPQLERDNWINLNGHWDYAVTSRDAEKPEAWDGKLLVPFALESKLGGVQRLLFKDEALWYRRAFRHAQKEASRTLLNFEAVDYRCEAFVNGVSVGTHQGGNTPFSFDVTEALQDGENELVVRIEDDTEAWQLRGKQVKQPEGIWYTQVSGIWQTVWLEDTGATYVEDLHLSTDAAKGEIRCVVDAAGGKKPSRVEVTVFDGDKKVANVANDGSKLTLVVPDAKLWSPSSPHLYTLEIVLSGDNGEVLDRVKSYAGIRTVGKQRDDEGHLRFTLNGEEIFHWGPLDQGWWPDGLLTPPSDEAMLYDIRFLKEAGFNMIRKHIKVEPRRYYYHCDRLGMLVWQDQVSGGASPSWTFLKPDPKDADWPDDQHQQFMDEFESMVDTLENHPSIVVWVPFNEAWGQHRTTEVGEWTVARDPSRLVNIASGGNFWPVGDVVDFHSYPAPKFPFDKRRYGDFVKVVGEFGGHGYAVKDHLWVNSGRNWGYGGLPKDRAEYKRRFVDSINRLAELRSKGIAAGVYTQTTDVEGEINGLMTYDRKVIKIPADELARIHESLED
ncbi:glycoside hydrolase family 2 protein [Botrimarina hoheduenensis]|nr:sugar-binding domain-containing protein [Botrimarina hoheduenensis]